MLEIFFLSFARGKECQQECQQKRQLFQSVLLWGLVPFAFYWGTCLAQDYWIPGNACVSTKIRNWHGEKRHLSDWRTLRIWVQIPLHGSGYLATIVLFDLKNMFISHHSLTSIFTVVCRCRLNIYIYIYIRWLINRGVTPSVQPIGKNRYLASIFLWFPNGDLCCGPGAHRNGPTQRHLVSWPIEPEITWVLVSRLPRFPAQSKRMETYLVLYPCGETFFDRSLLPEISSLDDSVAPHFLSFFQG